MSELITPKEYTPVISSLETQRAIKKIKDYFQQELAYGLNLRRVSAPLFVDPKTGLKKSELYIKGIGRKRSGNRSVAGKMETHGSWKVWN